jgi:hypothetical protein
VQSIRGNTHLYIRFDEQPTKEQAKAIAGLTCEALGVEPDMSSTSESDQIIGLADKAIPNFEEASATTSLKDFLNVDDNLKFIYSSSKGTVNNFSGGLEGRVKNIKRWSKFVEKGEPIPMGSTNSTEALNLIISAIKPGIERECEEKGPPVASNVCSHKLTPKMMARLVVTIAECIDTSIVACNNIGYFNERFGHTNIQFSFPSKIINHLMGRSSKIAWDVIKSLTTSSTGFSQHKHTRLYSIDWKKLLLNHENCVTFNKAVDILLSNGKDSIRRILIHDDAVYNDVIKDLNLKKIWLKSEIQEPFIKEMCVYSLHAKRLQKSQVMRHHQMTQAPLRSTETVNHSKPYETRMSEPEAIVNHQRHVTHWHEEWRKKTG